MSLIKKNIIANFGGNIWTGIMSIIFVPFYIHFIGIEAYGLIGIFGSLLALFALLDMGIGATINREMARLSVQDNSSKEIRDLLRTLEIPYWIVACLISISVVALAPLIAHHWVNTEFLSPDSVQRAIMIMGITIAFQWPMGLYAGGMRGLERQVYLNGIDASMATFRGIGAVLILWLVSPTVEAFFLWQIVISATHTAIVGLSLWRSLPKSGSTPRFQTRLLKNIWRFAAGITGTNFLTTIIRQMDKVILTKMLTLEMFGYYSLANIIVMNMNRLSGPVVKAVYPRLASLFAAKDNEEIVKLYHKSSQLVSVLILPASAVVAFFSKEILLLWTRDIVTADQTYLLVSILIIGTVFNSLMFIPYSLQLASGWTKLGFLTNLVSVFILVPLFFFLIRQFGAVGAAASWGILSIGYFLFTIPIMHTRLIPDEKWRWYFEDIALPLSVALFVVGSFRLAVPVPGQDILLVTYLFVVSIVTLGAVAIATPTTRSWFFTKYLNN